MKQRILDIIPQVRAQSPLVHCMTNYVTVNDVANALLAIGASPIMSDDIVDAPDIARISSALDINIGTLNARTIESMIVAGKAANEVGIPVILDPVGAGASMLRNETTQRLLDEVRFAVIRGNISELGFIAGLEVATKGVDAAESDEGKDAPAIAKKVAKAYGAVAAITGAIDTVSDGETVVRIANGHPMLKSVTGTGCMTTALVGAWVAASRANGAEDALAGAAGAIALMGIAGEIAFETAGDKGTGSFHIALIDALSTIDAATMDARLKLEIA